MAFLITITEEAEAQMRALPVREQRILNEEFHGHEDRPSQSTQGGPPGDAD